MQQTDEQLILDFQQGAEEAFVALFQRHKNAILNFALRYLGNRADAEDVTGEVFMTLFSKKTAYHPQPQARFTTWLFTVARNACVSRIRQRNRLSSLWFHKDQDGGYAQWDPEDTAPLPREQLIQAEEHQLIQRAMAQLVPAQREALILKEYHQFRYAEIAEIMGCSLENVKILIHRARQGLRRHYPALIKEDPHD